MLTRWDDYRACRDSFLAGGFDPEFCEYLVVDNSQGNKADAYTALNDFLQVASAEIIVIHHQDIALLDDDVAVFSARLEELTALDPTWGVCGNAGTAEDPTTERF